MQGLVSSIQRFSTGDGPGIRTTVFLKGCNLRCAWCHNPEDLRAENELQYTERNCTQCLRCVAVCPTNAFSLGGRGERVFDVEKCTLCGECVQNCDYDALRFIGKSMSSEELLEVVLKDRAFYDRSGGGLTFSGGEPLLQADFVDAVCSAANAEGVSTAIETAAHVDFHIFERLLRKVDLFLVDIKLMDGNLHKAWTGVSNARILENILALDGAGVDLVVRIPLIASINDTDENMEKTAGFLKRLPNLRYVELLAYHDLGLEKVRMLQHGQRQTRFATPQRSAIEGLSCLLKNEGINVRY